MNEPENYNKRVKKFYEKYFKRVRRTSSLRYVCQQSGKCYNKIYKLNCKEGLWEKPGEYDHTLVFYIAGWLKDNINNDYVHCLTQRELANEITEQTLAYLNGFWWLKNIFILER